MAIVVVLIGLLFGGGIFLIFLALSIFIRPREMAQERLIEVASRPGATFEELRREQPFNDRVLTPVGKWLGNLVKSRTKSQRQIAISKSLVKAGYPRGLTVDTFLASKAIIAIVVALIAYPLAVLDQVSFFSTPVAFSSALLVIPIGLIGYVFPDLWLKQKVNQRKDQILSQLPQVLDLLSVCADAGLTFDAGLLRLIKPGQNLDGALVEEIKGVLHEVRLGRPRSESLQNMGKKMEISDLNSFITALIQAEKLGVPIAEVLRVQGEEIRRKARERAEIKASQAPVKMLFPLVGCIFPTVFFMLLGPAIILGIQAFSGKTP
jgi:tight adherence protein C